MNRLEQIPGSIGRTIPNPFADEEIGRLDRIKTSGGKKAWAYYLGRAVIANALMPLSVDRERANNYRENVRALGVLVEEAQGSRVLYGRYIAGAREELEVRRALRNGSPREKRRLTTMILGMLQ